MTRGLVLASFLALVGVSAYGQESDVTRVKTTTTTVDSGADVISELWFFEDATPVPCGHFDLRLTGRWVTGSGDYNAGDSDDDFIFQPSLVWGIFENVEASVGVPIWLGDSGDAGPNKDGNYDTNVGVLWRLKEQEGYWPAFAVSSHARVPTGDGSSGVDGELRLVFTNEYESGIRSHVNLFGATLNGNNDENRRNCTYGGVVGLDGPLSEDGSVRWVADYMHRGGIHNGASNSNLLELGWELKMAEGHQLGMSTQIGLDDNEDTPNFGASITYSIPLN